MTKPKITAQMVAAVRTSVEVEVVPGVVWTRRTAILAAIAQLTKLLDDPTIDEPIG